MLRSAQACRFQAKVSDCRFGGKVFRGRGCHGRERTMLKTVNVIYLFIFNFFGCGGIVGWVRSMQSFTAKLADQNG